MNLTRGSSSLLEVWKDHSGRTKEAGVPQRLLPGNRSRCAWIFQNLSDQSIWWRWGEDVEPGPGSFECKPGGFIIDDGPFISIEEVWIWAPHAGQGFSCKEGSLGGENASR